MLTDFDKAIEKLKQYDRQDRANEAIAKTAEPLIKGFTPGYNYLTPDQFRAVMQYFYPYDNNEIREKAIANRSYRLSGGIELVMVDWLTKDRLFTITDLSVRTGIPYGTLYARIKSLNVPQKRKGNKVFYDIDMLHDILVDRI
jgi:hypothetical protein